MCCVFAHMRHRWVWFFALALLVGACGQPDQDPALNEAPTLVAQPVVVTSATLPTAPPAPVAPVVVPITPPAIPIPPNAQDIQPCSSGKGCPAQCLSGPGCIATTPVPAPAGADRSVMWIEATDKINLTYPPDHKLSDDDIEVFYTAYLGPLNWQRAPARMCRRVDEFDLELREIVTYNLTTSQGNMTLRWCLIIAEWNPGPAWNPGPIVTPTLPPYPVNRLHPQYLRIFWGYQLDATLTPFPPTFPPGTELHRTYPAPGTGTGILYPAPVDPVAIPSAVTVAPAQRAYPLAPTVEPPTSAPAP